MFTKKLSHRDLVDILSLLIALTTFLAFLTLPSFQEILKPSFTSQAAQAQSNLTN